MSSVQVEYAHHERSDSDRSLDLQYAPAYYDESLNPNSGWPLQEFLINDSLLPQTDLALHDKHGLQTSDVDAHDSKRQEVGTENEKKKPGRKPITNEPTTKRKAQNRAAQRAFRERKENHVKTLEARVAELEQQNNSQSMENQYLKAQLARLGRDSSFAHSKAFTFEVPASQAARNDSFGNSTSSESEKVPTPSQCPSLCSSSNESPRSGSEKEFNAASMPLFSRTDSYAGSQNSSSTSSIATTLACGPTSPNSNSSSSNLAATRQDQPSTTHQAPQDINSLTFTDNVLSQSSPFTLSGMNYRDSGNPFGSFDADPPLFDAIDTREYQQYTDPVFDLMPYETLTNGLLPIKQEEDSSLSTLPSATSSTDPGTSQDLPLLNEKCPEVWRKVVSHPKFASFNLDALCQEFAVKNTCTLNSSASYQEDHWGDFDRHLDDFAARTEQKKAQV